MSVQSHSFVIEPGVEVAGEIRVPGDKSISHRAAIFGAIAEGITEVRNFLEGEDCLATLATCAAMGVRIERPATGPMRLHGVGMGGLRAASTTLDLGNSGTGMRLLAGLLSGQEFDSILIGDASLMSRPMERVATPLRRMGADIRTNEGRPPLVIRGGRRLQGCEHRLELPSAQVKSAILLAGLQAEGRTTVLEPGVSRDHTENMFESFGVALSREPGAVSLSGPGRLAGCQIEVPGDFSSAAFFIVAGLIAGRAPLLIRRVGVNATRSALLDILRLMGGDIRLHRLADAEREMVADIEVRPSQLHGIEVPAALVPIAMDELPCLFVAAAVAKGSTIVTGAAELRVKESDRLATMSEGLAALGVAVEPLPDGLHVRGGPVSGGAVDARGDHRIAMSFAVLGSCAEAPVTIRGVQNVATSFPGFAGTARTAGLQLVEKN